MSIDDIKRRLDIAKRISAYRSDATLNHAIEDVDALLAEVERLTAALAEAERAVFAPMRVEKLYPDREVRICDGCGACVEKPHAWSECYELMRSAFFNAAEDGKEQAARADKAEAERDEARRERDAERARADEAEQRAAARADDLATAEEMLARAGVDPDAIVFEGSAEDAIRFLEGDATPPAPAPAGEAAPAGLAADFDEPDARAYTVGDALGLRRDDERLVDALVYERTKGLQLAAVVVAWIERLDRAARKGGG